MKNTTAYIDEEKASNDISEDLILELVGGVWLCLVVFGGSDADAVMLLTLMMIVWVLFVCLFACWCSAGGL